MERERKRFKRRYGMRMDGAAMRRIQLALLQRSRQPWTEGSPRPTKPASAG